MRVRVQRDDRQQIRQNIDSFILPHVVTPVKSRKAWFLKNRWPGQTGGVFVLLSVYLQGWMGHTASWEALPSD